MATVKNILAKFINRNKRDTSDGPKTAIQQFNVIFKLINFLAYLVGIELTSDWNFNSRAKSNLFMNACVNWVELYTFCLLFPSIDCVELSAGIMISATVRRSLFKVTVKFSYFVFNHERFMSLVDFIHELANKNTKGERHLILLETTKTILYHFKLVAAGFSFAAVLYFCYPICDYMFNGNLTPMSPLVFPFAADDSTRSYLITTICNIIPPGWNVLGIAAVSWIFMTFVDVYAGLVTLIDDDFHTFDRMVRRQHQNVHLRNVIFRNIMMEIMDLARYNFTLNELFSFISTMQVGSCFLGISTAIFGYLANDFYGGVGAVLYFATELMMFCYIGQLVDNQTQRMEMVIFNSDWYGYEVYYQKDLLFALCIVQKLKSPDVAGIMPLNFEAGVEVAKNIYSIIMFLLNVLE